MIGNPRESVENARATLANMKIQREGINTVIVIQDEGAGHIQADKEDGTRAELPRRGSAHNIRHRRSAGSMTMRLRKEFNPATVDCGRQGVDGSHEDSESAVALRTSTYVQNPGDCAGTTKDRVFQERQQIMGRDTTLHGWAVRWKSWSSRN